MSTKRFTPMRARAVATLAAAAVVTGIAAVPAFSTADAASNRIAGDDRYDTAARVAVARNGTSAPTVVLASGADFPDALAGAALAGASNAPILLTEQGRLPAATSKALDDLKTTRVFVLGGTSAVSDAVVTSLGARTVTRLAGDDRFATAAKIAEQIGSANVASLGGKKTAIVATGSAAADALAGSPLAAAGAGATGVHPVLLVGADVPAVTEASLRALGITQVVILGGTNAVSDAVETRLESITGGDAIRLAGADRYATAAAVAAKGVESFGLADTEVLLANGLGFADALAGGPLGEKRNATVLLTGSESLAPAAQEFIAGRSARVRTITALGGTTVLPDGVVAAAVQAAKSEAPARKNEAIVVAPGSRLTAGNADSREYTVTGVTGTVDIALLDCGTDVSTDAAGNTVFRNTNGNAMADGSAKNADTGGQTVDVAATAARISTVNGTPPPATTVSNNDFADNVLPTNSTVTFVVTGPGTTSQATSCVVPLVFADVNGDSALNVTSGTTTPTESFGTGGSTVFTPNPAAAGAFGPADVESTEGAVNKDADRFSACAIVIATPETTNQATGCASYAYDAGDTFEVAGAATTMADFEARLNGGDDVTGTYTPGGQSRFNLIDEGPAPTTTTTTPPAAPASLIVSDAGRLNPRATESTINPNDVIRLVFSKPIAEDSVTNGVLTVSGSDGTTAGTISGYQIVCGTAPAGGAGATCSRSADGTTITMTVTTVNGTSPQYGSNGLTITGATFRAANSEAVDIPRSGTAGDVTIKFLD